MYVVRCPMVREVFIAKAATRVDSSVSDELPTYKLISLTTRLWGVLGKRLLIQCNYLSCSVPRGSASDA